MTDITLMGPRTLSILQVGITQEYRDQMVDEVYRLVGPEDYKTNVQAKMTGYHLHHQSNVFNEFIKVASGLRKFSNWLNVDVLDECRLNDFWGAIYSKGDYAARHSHRPAQYSFVYFLKVGASDTPLVFDELNYSYTPTEDEIIFFPGDLMHHVPAHMHNEERIILAGNVHLFETDGVMNIDEIKEMKYA